MPRRRVWETPRQPSPAAVWFTLTVVGCSFFLRDTVAPGSSSFSSPSALLFAVAEGYQTYRSPAEGYTSNIQPQPNYGEDEDNEDLPPSIVSSSSSSSTTTTTTTTTTHLTPAPSPLLSQPQPPPHSEVEIKPTTTTEFPSVDVSIPTPATTVKRVVPQTSISASDAGVSRVPLGMDVDPSVGYPMPDIIVAQNSDGKPAIDLLELNSRNPAMRARTSYTPGERRYLPGYASALLKIEHGVVYSYEDDIVVGDASRVFMMGGCGANMAGWAVATTDDGHGGLIKEWDSPSMDDLSKDGLHRFGKLAVLVQRLGRTYFHWMTETLPRLTQFLTVLRNDGPDALRRVRYLAYDIPFVHDALRLLGIDMGRQVIFFDPDSIYTADTLYAISSAPCGQPPRPLLQHAREHVFNYLFPSPPPDAPPNVIERARRRLNYANRRGVALLVLQGGARGGSAGGGGRSASDAFSNVEEVTDVLRRVFIENMSKQGRKIDLIVVDSRSRPGDGKKGGRASFLSQYSLWRRAELVVAMSGGSLANMMWTQNGTKVVELIPILPESMGRRATITYADMAGSLQLPYAMVPINTTTPSERFKVPINYLESALRLVMEM